MLQNEVYIGNMVQGRMRKVSYKSKKCIRLPREQWIIVENTHEPIIGREIFNKVALHIKSRTKTRVRTHDYLLKGLIFCHECGYPLAVVMRVLSGNRETLYFICRTYQRFTKQGVCTSHCVRVETITELIGAKIRELCSSYLANLNMSDITKDARAALSAQHSHHEDETMRIKTAIEAAKKKIDRVYDDRFIGIVDEADFQRLYARFKEEQSALQERLREVSRNDTDTPMPVLERAKAEKLARKFIECANVDRDLVVSLIEKITLTDNKEIHIHFRINAMNVQKNYLQ